MNNKPVHEPSSGSQPSRDNLQRDDPQRDDDQQWDVERYLLNDPALDRDAFEQRMLDDTSLAEQVAASVAHLSLVAEAASGTSAYSAHCQTASALRTQAMRRTTPIWISRFVALASAATLIFAISVWQFRSTTNDDQLARIAENWTAFENLTADEAVELTAASQSLLVDSLPNEDEFRADDMTESTSTDQRDWLVEAAREFYLASSEGAAG